MTNPLQERRLGEFVDRRQELAAFVQMISSNEKPIMVVWGAPGMGKTSLLMRLVHECATRQLRKAEIMWKDTNPHDYLAVMRKIRDDLGPEHFPAFTDLANFYYEPDYEPQLKITLGLQGAAVNVAQGMTVSSGASVGDIAAVIIKDSMIVMPRKELAVPESERRSRLTHRFIADLKLLLARESLVVFLDAVEKMSTETEKWVWDDLLDAVRQGILTNIKFVLCGEKQPPGDRDWEFFISPADLKPLGHEDIAVYLKKRVPDLDDEVRLHLALMILGSTGGTPGDVGKSVDTYMKLMASSDV